MTAPEWLPDVAPAASLDVDHATGGDDRALDALNASIAEEHAAAERAPDAAEARIAEINAILDHADRVIADTTPPTPADLAHRKLVALADGLRGIGQERYATSSEKAYHLIVEAGGHVEPMCAWCVVEGVRLLAWAPAVRA